MRSLYLKIIAFVQLGAALCLSACTSSINSTQSQVSEQRSGATSSSEAAPGTPTPSPDTAGAAPTVDSIVKQISELQDETTQATKPNAPSLLKTIATLQDQINSLNIAPDAKDSLLHQLDTLTALIAASTSSQSSHTTTPVQTSTTVPPLPPVPGANGVITVDNRGESSLRLTWSPAVSAADADQLTYEVYQSVSDPLQNLADTETQGQVVVAAQAGLLNYTITGLVEGQSYYFNVVVKDNIGNAAAYVAKAVTTLVAPPVFPSNALSATSVNSTSLTLNWSHAVDGGTPSNAIVYQAYQASANNITTLTEVESNGTPLGAPAAGINHLDVTGLTEGATYFFNVVAQDLDGRKSIATPLTVTTSLIPPVPGATGTITTTNLAPDGVTLTWTHATDNVTTQSALRYQVYQSSNNDLTSVQSTLQHGTPLGTLTANLASYTVGNLLPAQTYYFNVVVSDLAGAQSLYTAVQVTTSNVPWPVPGSGGVLHTYMNNYSDFVLSWTKANDTVTPQANLQYLVYWSNGIDIPTLSDVKAFGTPIGSYAPDFNSSHVVSGSSPFMYYNVLVKDTDGNESAYHSTHPIDNDLGPPVVADGQITVNSVNDTSASLTWNMGIDVDGGPATLSYYAVVSSADNVRTFADTTNGKTFNLAYGNPVNGLVTGTLAGLLPDTSYFINIVVADSTWDRAAYTSFPLTTDVSPPLTPTAVAEDAATSLTWKVVPGVTGYNLYWSNALPVSTTSNKITLSTPSTPSYHHTGLTNGQAYYYAVSAQKNSYETPLTDVVRVTPSQAPSWINAGFGRQRNTLAWAQIPTATSYNLYWNNSGNVSTSDYVIHNVTSPYVHNGLTDNTNYYYAVTAVFGGTEGPLSQQTAAQPSEVDFLKIPQNTALYHSLPASWISKVVTFGSNVYVLTQQGMGISVDDGATFRTVTAAQGLGATTLFSVAAETGYLYVSSYGGVAVSSDGGVSFQNHGVSSGLGAAYVPAVCAANGRLYALAQTLYVSTDHGTSFTQASATDLSSAYYLACSGNNVYAYGASLGGVAVSSDGGSTFSLKTTSDGLVANFVSGLCVDGSNVYVATQAGLSISTNGGASFGVSKTTADGLASNYLTSVYASGSKVYVGSSTGLSRSTDGGASFTAAGTAADLPPSNYAISTLSIGQDGTVYGGAYDGLYRSFDGGASFLPTHDQSGFGSAEMNLVRIDGGNIYEGTNSGIFKSTDGGQSFVQLNGTDAGDFFVGLVVNGSKIYALGHDNFYRSTDGGQTFIASRYAADGLTDSPFFQSLYVSGQNVYIGSNNALAVSTDGGATFTNKVGSPGLPSNYFQSITGDGINVYIATYSGLAVTSDNGATFVIRTTANGLGSNAINQVSASGGRLYAATGGGLSVSSDGGATFVNKTSAQGLGGDSIDAVYASGSTVYATSGDPTYKLTVSTDSGNSFGPVTGLGSFYETISTSVGSTFYTPDLYMTNPP